MKQNFRKAKRIAVTKRIIAINGCCYGQEPSPEKEEYRKLCGQAFWEFISGNANLFTDIIEPLGHRAKQRNETFAEEYGKVVNRFTGEFIAEFCHPDGTILWQKVVEFNSARQ